MRSQQYFKFLYIMTVKIRTRLLCNKSILIKVFLRLAERTLLL